MKPSVTHEKLLSNVVYDRETGIFQWKHRLDVPKWWNGRYAGNVINNLDAYGYLTVGMYGRTYKAHRLAWFYVTGEWPVGEIDHKDGDRSNNKFSNLRDVDDAQNAVNAGLRSDSTSGLKGVSRRPNGKWCAQINIAGKRKCLGYFLDKFAAKRAYDAAAVANFGEFARVA